MTKTEFLTYLLVSGLVSTESRFHGDALLLELITTPPLGWSIYEREVKRDV